MDSDNTKTTKKGKKHKGKGNRRSKTQDFANRRRLFEEHRPTAKREGVIDLDLLATLTGLATSVSDGAAVGFAVVDKKDQGDAEQVSLSPWA